MNVYIKGMEMPGTGRYLIVYPDGRVVDTDIDGESQCIIPGSKAIPVPNHGDLIDRDKLEKDIDKYIGGEESRSRFHHWVQVQDAVIPMDKGGRKVIPVSDLLKWADEHAIGRSPSYPRGWVSASDLLVLTRLVEAQDPLNFYYSTRSNIPEEVKDERI